MNTPRYTIGQPVEVSGFKGLIDEVAIQSDESISYVVKSDEAPWLQNHVIVEEAIIATVN